MTSDFHIDINQYMPLREVVFTTLRQAILKGELKPGERLMEVTLANRLGVSRTPIREAMRKLELEGLVVMIPRKGAQVAHITEQELNDVLEVRRGLEELAIEKSCERISEEELKTLKESTERFRVLVEANDLMALAEEDVKFHETIYASTHNRRLIQILSNLREQMYRFRMEYLKDEAVRENLYDEHLMIYQALSEHQKNQANIYICRHIDNQQAAIIRSLKKE